MSAGPLLRRKHGLSLVERLERHSVPVPFAGCWLWTGCANRYGQLRYRRKTIKAHRLAWEVKHGPIPNGMNVLHRCDTPLCINVAHLFLGTQADNVADCDAKGRRGVVVGEAHVRAKVTATDVRAIRSDNRTLAALSAAYGLGETQIARIKHGESWKHVEAYS